MRTSRLLLLAPLVFAASACGGPSPPAGPAQPAASGEPTTVVKLVSGEGGFDPDDRDGDGVGDAYDLCPAHTEDGRAAHPWDGCPDERDPAKRVTPWGPAPRQAVKVTRSQIKISEEIRFGTSSATIDPSSQPLLQSIAQVLKDVPEIEIVEIAGHADRSGSDEKNKKLTEARAASVMADLARKGIAKGRLRAVGYSAYCVLDSGMDEAAHAKNRRVEFRILRRDGEDLEPRWGGCEEAEKRGMKPTSLPALSAKLAPSEDKKNVRECVEGDVRGCSARCDRGEVAACEALANLVTDEPKRAFAAASKACKLGALHFCVKVAAHLREGKGASKDLRRAHEIVLDACGKGSGRSCTDAGLDHHNGSAVAKDEAKAVELYQRGCDNGDAGGCERVGASLWSGTAGTKNRPRAIDAYAAGCELGGATACAAIGAAYKEEPAALRNRGRALAALHVACEQDGSAPACEALKTLDEQPGEYATIPVCSAGDFKACRDACTARKSSPACVEFGVALLYGTGVRRRSADALALFDEACREGSAKGCAMSALALAGNNDDPKAERAAASGFEAACVLGEVTGCVNRAVMELEGLGTYRDEETAAQALDSACGKGIGIACAHLSAIVAKGVGVKADAARARSLVEKACTQGFRPACPAPAAPPM